MQDPLQRPGLRRLDQRNTTPGTLPGLVPWLRCLDQRNATLRPRHWLDCATWINAKQRNAQDFTWTVPPGSKQCNKLPWTAPPASKQCNASPWTAPHGLTSYTDWPPCVFLWVTYYQAVRYQQKKNANSYQQTNKRETAPSLSIKQINKKMNTRQSLLLNLAAME